VSPRLSALAAWLRSGLFRQAAAGPLGWRKILGGAAFLIVGAAVSLARTEGPGALNTTWIEDAGVFLEDALWKPVLTTLTTEHLGYYHTMPRAITAIAVVFPIQWAPGIMSAGAALQYAMFGLIAYIASGPYLHSRWLRLLVAVPACVVPLGYTQANNDLATVQFLALYGTFWLLLWRPVTRVGQVASPIIMLSVTLSSILPVVFAPLAVARLIADRSKNSIALVTCWAGGLLIQWTVQLRGMNDRHGSWFTNPLWVLGGYVTRTVPRAIFGERALGGPGTNGEGHPIPLNIPNVAAHNALVWGAWGVVVAAVIIALARLTAPHWPLAVTALLFSVLVLLAEIVDNLPIVQPRYVIAPALLLYTGIVAMLRPRGVADPAQPGGRGGTARPGDGPPAGGARRAPRPAVAWAPVAVFAVLLGVACGFNFRVHNNRSESPPWTAVVAAAQLRCQKPTLGDYIYRHAWWTVKIPCDRVRS
jgi:hypothetical protein